MSLRRVLYAGMKGRAGRIRPEVYELEILLVLLSKGDSRRAPPNRIYVELDGSIAERDAFQYGMAAVQPHQAVIKAQLPEELRVFLRLPMISRHRDHDRFRCLGNRKCRQKEEYAKRNPVQPSLATLHVKLLLIFDSLSDLLRRLDVAVLSKSSDCRTKVGKNQGWKIGDEEDEFFVLFPNSGNASLRTLLSFAIDVFEFSRYPTARGRCRAALPSFPATED